jgi:hypothetical protein
MNFTVFALWLGILWLSVDVIKETMLLNGYPRLLNG